VLDLEIVDSGCDLDDCLFAVLQARSQRGRAFSFLLKNES
jgi:hypothetical protein